MFHLTWYFIFLWLGVFTLHPCFALGHVHYYLERERIRATTWLMFLYKVWNPNPKMSYGSVIMHQVNILKSLKHQSQYLIQTTLSWRHLSHWKIGSNPNFKQKKESLGWNSHLWQEILHTNNNKTIILIANSLQEEVQNGKENTTIPRMIMS